MNKVLISLSTALVAATLAGCGSKSFPAVKAVEDSGAITLTRGLGGSVGLKRKLYAEIEATGKQVIIDGSMLSADAFFAFSLPGACYTRDAGFSPHAVSFLGVVPVSSKTEELTAMLPDELADWFRGSWYYYDWVFMPRLDWRELKEIWPAGACPEPDGVSLGDA